MTSRHNDSWDKRHKNKNEQDQIKKKKNKVFGKNDKLTEKYIMVSTLEICLQTAEGSHK